ncbi:hypothetical protein L6452_32357 [Arctium lappa]|uniref:Uncharacterized protein n=1 Tax=Arctium lappa TaxID=4217 RepID=A0ACB8Z4A0_ARCLA|nr:hypothetical protein L6452_32357 [Arctium lappa]
METQMLEKDDSANACGWKETCDHGDADTWNLEGNVKGSLELGRKPEWKLGDMNPNGPTVNTKNIHPNTKKDRTPPRFYRERLS